MDEQKLNKEAKIPWLLQVNFFWKVMIEGLGVFVQILPVKENILNN